MRSQGYTIHGQPYIDHVWCNSKVGMAAIVRCDRQLTMGSRCMV